MMKAKSTRKAKKILKSGLVDVPERPILRFKGRGKYKIVDGPTQSIIEPSTPECRTED